MLLARARRNTSLIEALWRWADVLAQVASTAKGREALVAFWVYALRVGDMKPEDLHHLAVEIGPTANEAYMTAAQVLHERGKAEGRAEGKAEGKAEVLLRLLVLKFGVVSDGLRERIRKASVNELDVWTDRLIMASSMDEMLGGDEPT